MEAKKKWCVPPAFGVEFASYFHDRTNRLEELRRSLEEQLRLQSKLREREAQHRPRFDLFSRKCEVMKEENEEARERAVDFRELLSKLRPSKFITALLIQKCPS